MTFASWLVDPTSPVLATAIHAGHDLRPAVAALLVLDELTRRREEDPHTEVIAAVLRSHVDVHRSRFEVDLNRDRDTAVYSGPEDAWGLSLWRHPPDAELIAGSRALHRRFYDRLAEVLDVLVALHGGFVLYDVHAYNHRREGPDGPPADPAENPEVNLGTGSMPPRWKPVAQAFLDAMGTAVVCGRPVDARENVAFRGRHMAQFVHDRYGDVGCALAIEFKKTFVDEWTDRVDAVRLHGLRRALADTAPTVWQEHGRCR